jgi:hypothetical protein
MARKSSPWMPNPRWVDFREAGDPTTDPVGRPSGDCCEQDLCPHIPLSTCGCFWNLRHVCHCLKRCGICWSFLGPKECTAGLY